MNSDFKTSRTAINLMRAFAGESQARNRYTFAADQAKNSNLHVIEAVFRFESHIIHMPFQGNCFITYS